MPQLLSVHAVILRLNNSPVNPRLAHDSNGSHGRTKKGPGKLVPETGNMTNRPVSWQSWSCYAGSLA